jgi:hypothetical protein
VIQGLARLPDLEAEQAPLPALEVSSSISFPVGSSWPASSAEESCDHRGFAKQIFPTPGRGQLTFEIDQQTLKELEPGPRQLALIPDPPPWEADPEPKLGRDTGARLSRRRTKLGISPGQASLF